MSTIALPPTLLEALASVPDPRSRRGRSYSLHSILALTVVAMLCGYRGYRAFAQWGRLYNHLVPHLGFDRPARDGQGWRTPCFSEFAAVFARLDVVAFEAALSRWIGAQGVADLPRRQIAIDGKVVRGSRDGDRPGVLLLAAYCHEAEATLAQLRVPETTNEHKTALELIRVIPLEGTTITGDAAFCQRDLCKEITEGGGDYLITVKANQPTLLEEIATGFTRAFSPGGAGATAGRRSGGYDARQGARPDRDPEDPGDEPPGGLPGLAGGAAGGGAGTDADHRGEEERGGGVRDHELVVVPGERGGATGDGASALGDRESLALCA